MFCLYLETYFKKVGKELGFLMMFLKNETMILKKLEALLGWSKLSNTK